MSFYQRAYWLLKQIKYYWHHKLEFLAVTFVGLLATAGKLLWWLLKNPARIGAVTVTAAATFQWGWRSGPIALASAVAVFTLAWIALVAERGTARGLSAILAGVYRLIRMRRLWAGMCEATGFKAYGGVPVPARDWRITQHGLEVMLAVGAMGKAETEAFKYTEAIRSNLYVDRVRMKKVSSGLVRLIIEWGNHLREFTSLAAIPPATREGYLALGVQEDGNVFELPIGKSVLATGLTGSGKSSFAWALVYALIKAGIPFRLTIANPKFVEWKIAKEALDESPIVYRYTDSPADLGDRGLRQGGFMWQINEELTEKLKRIPVGRRVHVATEDDPLDIVIIDETLPITKYLKKEDVNHPLAKMVYQGRACGSWAIFLSQTAEKDVIGPVRDLVPIKLAFALPGRNQTEMALGTDAINRGALPHLLDPTDDAGICYYATDEGHYGAARLGFATDRETPYLIMGQLPPEESALPDKYSYDRACYVYRYYGPDEEGFRELKYIGEAYDWETRYRQHERDEPEMMQEVVKDWTEVDLWPSKASAEVEERRLIKRLHPKWNKQHNGKYYRGVA